MNEYIGLLFLVLIVIIIVAVITGKYEILASIVALGAIYLYMRNQEKLEDKKVAVPDGEKITFEEGPTVDQIDIVQDVNSLDERVLGANVPADKYDNTDIVNQIIQGGNEPFQYNWKAATDTDNSEDHVYNKRNPYQPALTGKVNVDERLAIMQQHRGSLPKRAIDGMVRSQAPMFKRMFQDELEQNEHREWWTAKAQNMESDMNNWS